MRSGACVVKTTTNSPEKRKKWPRHFFIRKHSSDVCQTPTKLQTSQTFFEWLLSQNLRTWNLPAQCVHCVFIPFDMSVCSQSKFSDNSKRSSTLSSSFIQNLHEGLYSSITWPDERISSRALDGMPRSLKFWLLDNCFISFKMLLLMKQYFEYKILFFESVSFAILDLGILQS